MKTNDATKMALVRDFERVLDLGLIAEASKPVDKKEEGCSSLDPELARYIEERIEARKNAKLEKNYALADEIRKELSEKGITLIDTKEGTKYTIQ